MNNSDSPVDELFRGRTDPAFDELAAARTLAQMIVDGILQRERAARLVAFASRGPTMLTLGETVDSLVARTWEASDAGASRKFVGLRRVAQRRGTAGDTMQRAHWASIAGDFARWIDRRELPRPTPALMAPPGDPFGEP